MKIQEHGIVVDQLRDNMIIGNCAAKNSFVSFKGKGNILCLEDGVRLADSVISFCGDNSLIYLSSNPAHDYRLKIDAWRDTTIFFGKNNYFNSSFNAIISERKNLIVGGDGVFSFGVWLRTADPHLLYDVDTMKRINPSKSILIGDHVWIGQGALILKGSRIGSGSVIAAGTVIAGKTVGSNTVYAGNPARQIKDRIFFSGKSVHNYTKKQTKDNMSFKDTQYIFDNEKQTLDFNQLEKALEDEDAEERLKIIIKNLVQNEEKNRFYIQPTDINSSKRKRLFDFFR